MLSSKIASETAFIKLAWSSLINIDFVHSDRINWLYSNPAIT
jgi:hypothetical protein